MKGDDPMPRRLGIVEEPLVLLGTVGIVLALGAILIRGRSRRFRTLAAGLVAQGLVLDASGIERLGFLNWSPRMRGTWKGRAASIEYGGDRARYTRVAIEGHEIRIPGHARDPAIVARELDGLLTNHSR